MSNQPMAIRHSLHAMLLSLPLPSGERATLGGFITISVRKGDPKGWPTPYMIFSIDIDTGVLQRHVIRLLPTLGGPRAGL